MVENEGESGADKGRGIDGRHRTNIQKVGGSVTESLQEYGAYNPGLFLDRGQGRMEGLDRRGLAGGVFFDFELTDRKRCGKINPAHVVRRAVRPSRALLPGSAGRNGPEMLE